MPTDVVNNTPTSIKFTKEDFYRYIDASKRAKFENDQEVLDFDQIEFVLKSNGQTLSLCETTKSTDTNRKYRLIKSIDFNAFFILLGLLGIALFG